MFEGMQGAIYLIIATVIIAGVLFWIYRILQQNLKEENQEKKA
ncbi:MAG: hypothetical protein ABIA76_03825 [Candidatus Diapherotrites archaeon]